MFEIDEITIYMMPSRKILVYYKLSNSVQVKVRYKFTSKNLADKLRFFRFLKTTAIDFDKPTEEPLLLQPQDINLCN